MGKLVERKRPEKYDGRREPPTSGERWKAPSRPPVLWGQVEHIKRPLARLMADLKCGKLIE